MTPRVVVAGIGSDLRRDDGVGPAVVERVRHLGPGTDCALWSGPSPVDLLGLWGDAELALVVDATCDGLQPGTVRVVELDHAGTAAVQGSSSTHGFGLATVLRLGGVLGQVPRRVVLVGVEGGDFGPGFGLSPAVEAAVEGAAARVLELSAGVR